MSQKHCCIIPVRAGSKGIKDKNLTRLEGKTLVRIAVEKALQSEVFSRVIVSTDYPRHRLGLEDLSGGILCQLEVNQRPYHLCQDDSLMIDVVKHEAEKTKLFQWIWVTQVTSPFSTLEDYRNVKKMIDTGNYESVISFKEVKEHPNRMYTHKIEEKDLWTVDKAYRLRHAGYKNRQELPDIFIRSGNFYATKYDHIVGPDEPTLENKPVGFYEVDRVKGLNMDDQEDLVMVKYYAQKGYFKYGR